MKRLIAAAIVCLWCSPLLAAGWLPLAFQQCGGLPPSQAVAAGYNTQTVCSPMNSLSLLDLNNTLNPGYLLYMQNEGQTNSASNFSLGPGYLNVNTVAAGTGGCCGPTTIPVNGATFNPGGTIIQPGGFYIEVQTQFDPTYTNNTTAWPAFWLQQPGWFALGDTTSPNTELDIFEWDNAQYLTTAHQWPAANGGIVVQNCQNANNAPTISTPNGFHTYGLLLIPSYNNGGTGQIKWYLDNVLQTTVTYSGNSTPSSGVCPAGAFQSADTQQYGIAFSSGITGQGGGGSAVTGFKNLHVWQASATPTVPYLGPGDINSGALAWWGLRAYSQAKAAATANIGLFERTSDSTTCTGKSNTSGNLDLTTAYCPGTTTLPNFCSASGGSCGVQTLYDQSGGTNCATFACDLVQAIAVDQPTLVFGCRGILPCMSFNGTTQFMATAHNGFEPSFPITFSHVFNQTVSGVNICGTGASCVLINDDPNNNFLEDYASSSGIGNQHVCLTFDSAVCTANGTLPVNTWHSLQNVFNAASSIVFLDGASVTIGNPGNTGAAAPTSPLFIGSDSFGDLFQGEMAENGIWLSGNSTQAANMCHNQFSYWGTATAC